jgi:hypothetical protein
MENKHPGFCAVPVLRFARTRTLLNLPYHLVDGGNATPFGVGILNLILIPQWRGGAPLGANAMKTLRVLPGHRRRFRTPRASLGLIWHIRMPGGGFRRASGWRVRLVKPREFVLAAAPW